MSHKHTYTLTALQHFKCLAGDCPDTCCRNWDISVDAGTEQRWRSLDDEDTKKYLFDNLVSKSEDGERGDAQFHRGSRCVDQQIDRETIHAGH